jgi:hypothetical protein
MKENIVLPLLTHRNLLLLKHARVSSIDLNTVGIMHYLVSLSNLQVWGTGVVL